MSPTKDTGESTDKPLDAVTVIVEALTQRYGSLALQAAEKQRNAAADDTVIRWDEIIARLQDR